MLQIQFVSFQATIVFFPEWFLAEAQSRLELALSASSTVLSSTVDAAPPSGKSRLGFSATSEVSSPLEQSLLILQVLKLHPELYLSSGASSSVVLPSTSSASDD